MNCPQAIAVPDLSCYFTDGKFNFPGSLGVKKEYPKKGRNVNEKLSGGKIGMKLDNPFFLELLNSIFANSEVFCQNGLIVLAH